MTERPVMDAHPESCGCHWCSPKPAYRNVNGIPFERITIDPKALTFAADEYAASTGHVDEIALGHAILGYLEAEQAA